jgi:metal-sulfur cluster biosynthetic enzyme
VIGEDDLQAKVRGVKVTFELKMSFCRKASNVEYQVEPGSEKIRGEVTSRRIDMQEP